MKPLFLATLLTVSLFGSTDYRQLADVVDLLLTQFYKMHKIQTSLDSNVSTAMKRMDAIEALPRCDCKKMAAKNSVLAEKLNKQTSQIASHINLIKQLQSRLSIMDKRLSSLEHNRTLELVKTPQVFQRPMQSEPKSIKKPDGSQDKAQTKRLHEQSIRFNQFLQDFNNSEPIILK